MFFCIKFMKLAQQLVYNYILKNQPICDKCIAKHFGYGHPQQANTICRQLRDLEIILRVKINCPKCKRNVIINFVAK